MKTYLSIILLFSFSVLSTELLARERGRHVVVTKIGSFNLDKTVQSSSRNFTKKSKDVYGFEYEWHLVKGLSIGGEFFHYTNNFTATSSYKAETTAHLFNVKYNFNHEGSFQPFIGLGAGFSLIRPTGEPLIDYHVGSAHQLMAGFTYRFEYVGIYAEYKMLRTKPDDEVYSATSEIDASGKGLLIGVSVLF